MRLLLILLLLVSSGAMAQKLNSMSYYTTHPKVSKAAKDFYKKLPKYRKNHTLYINDIQRDNIINPIIDSVFTSNNQTRPFYLFLMNQNMDLAEGLLLMYSLTNQFKLIETRPVVFFRYMLDNPNEKKNYFNKWADNMVDFSDKYCQTYQNKSEENCLPAWSRGVMALLANENRSIRNLAKDFFRLMKIPLDEQLPPHDDMPPGPSNNIKIGEGDNGKTFRVVNGSNIEARFRECRGCASIWKIAAIDNSKIRFLNDAHANPSCTDCVGGNQDHIFNLRATGKGRSTLSFTYFSQTVTVYIVVD